MPVSLPLLDGKTTQAIIDQYWADGYLFPIDVYDANEAAEYRAEFEKMEAKWLDNGLPLPLATYKRVGSNIVMPLADHIAHHPGILDVVEGVLGPDIMVYSAEFFIKEPRTTHIVSMHQDLTYWGLGAIDGLVTVWAPLSPATRASGCMDFVRGSHKNPILDHEDTFDKNNMLSRGQEVKVNVKDEDKTAIELQPGQISLHHGLTIHGSGPNSSHDRRIACVIRYIRPDMAQQSGRADYATLARGADRFGNFRPARRPQDYFEPEALDLYEEIREAQRQNTMNDAKGTTEMYS